MKITQSKTAVLTGLAVLSSLLFFMGCLPLLSLHPTYTDETVIFEEKLLGKWYGEDQIWQFTRDGDKKYNLHVEDEDGQGDFEVHLMQLEGHLFLDLYPGDNEMLANTAVVYRVALIPTHVLLEARQTDNQLILRLVHSEGILKEDPNALRNEEISDDFFLITDGPEELQRVLIDNLDNDDVIDKDEHIFYRGVGLYSQDNITFSEKLLGQWQSEEGEMVDCIPWENGYDIIVAENKGRDISFKAYLVNIQQQSYLAVFTSEPEQKDIENGINLCPDKLFRIEQMEPELKLQEVDLFKSMELGCLQEETNESNTVYRRI